MSEFVRNSLEKMLPELSDLERRKIFNQEEIRKIVKARTNFEYSLQRRGLLLNDFLRYIEHEMKVEFERRTRIKTHGLFLKKRTISDWSIITRIFDIFKLAVRRFPQDVQLWVQFIDWAVKMNSHRQLQHLIPQALRQHPLVPRLWIKAAQYEYSFLGNMDTARTYFQRALRLNINSLEIWYEFFRTEILYIGRVVNRKVIIGSIPNKTQLKRYLARLNENHGDDGDESSVTGGNSSIETRNDWNPESCAKLTDGEVSLLSGIIPKTLYLNASRAIYRMKPLFSTHDKLRFLTMIEQWNDGKQEVDYHCLAAAGIQLTELYQVILVDIFESIARDFSLCRTTPSEDLTTSLSQFWDCYSRLPLLCDVEFDLPLDLLNSDSSSDSDSGSDSDSSSDDDSSSSSDDSDDITNTDIDTLPSHPEHNIRSPIQLEFPPPPQSLPSFEQSVITRYLFGISVFNEYNGHSYLPSIIYQLIQYINDRIRFYITQYQSKMKKSATTAIDDAPHNNYHTLCYQHAVEYLNYSFNIYHWSYTMDWLNAPLYYSWIQATQGLVDGILLIPNIDLSLPSISPSPIKVNDINADDARSFTKVMGYAITYLFQTRDATSSLQIQDPHYKRFSDNQKTLPSAVQQKKQKKQEKQEKQSQPTKQPTSTHLREDLIAYIHQSYANKLLSPSHHGNIHDLSQFKRLYDSLIIFHSTHIHYITFPAALLLWESFSHCHVMLSTTASFTSKYQQICIQTLNQSVFFHSFLQLMNSASSSLSSTSLLTSFNEAVIFIYQSAIEFCHQHKVNMLNYSQSSKKQGNDHESSSSSTTATATPTEQGSEVSATGMDAEDEYAIKSVQGLGAIKLGLNKFKALAIQYCSYLLPLVNQSNIEHATDTSFFSYETEDLFDDSDDDSDSDNDSESDSDSDSGSDQHISSLTSKTSALHIQSVTTSSFYTALQLIQRTINFVLRPNYSPHAPATYNSILDLEISLFYHIVQRQLDAKSTSLSYQQLRAKRDTHLQSIRRAFTLAVSDIGRYNIDIYIKYLTFLVHLQRNLFKFTNPLAYKNTDSSIKKTNNDFINNANDPNNLNAELQQSILQEIASIQQNALRTLRAKYKAAFISAADSVTQNAS